VATLSIAALKKHITDKRLAPLYVFVGEDVKLVERMVDAVEETVDAGDRPFAVERLYAGDTGGSPIDIASAARIRPMLGDRRIVIVLRAERLLKPKRASKSADIDDADEGDDEDAGAVDFGALEDYVASPVEESTVVFVATEVDRARRFSKKLMEKAQVVLFGGLGGGQTRPQEVRAAAMELLQAEFARAGRAIDPPALNLLADRAGDDISKLRGDLERLLLYTEGQARITRDDVAEVTSSDASVRDDWAMVNAIADGDAGRALREVSARLDRGDSPHAVVGQLRWWVSSRLAEADADRVRPALEALCRTDLALKSSGGEDSVLLERLVVELTGRALPRRSW